MEEAFRKAFDRATRWMRENGAPLLASNLRRGADAAALDACEQRVGFPIGAELRALWSVHDGQNDEGNGFYESFDLLSSQQAEPEDVRVFLPFLREETSEAGVRQSGLTPEELASESWVCFAARDSDGLAVNTESGRVFRIRHDDSPALHYLAPSLLAWLTTYADAVSAGDFAVEEGFGDYYLSKRDRRAEAREAAIETERARRDALPPLDLLELAIASKDESAALDALSKTNGPAQMAFLEAIFTRAPAAFAVSALRPRLSTLQLTKAQWSVVSEGAKKLGNNALLALAEKNLKA